jgi:FkbM family methyltransferase
MYRRALRYGVAAAVEHDAVPFRHEFRLILDVGANRGQFALVAARRFPQAALVCFEPLSQPRATLERALHWHRDLDLIACAVSTHAGEAEFVISRADDSSSLLPMTETQSQHFPGTGAASRTVVRTAPLDDLVAPERRLRPCLLKIDVQGAELDVLKGASDVLGAVDSVLVECSFVELYRGQALVGEMVDGLHGRGFVLTALCSPIADRSGRVLQADLLFERRY